MKYIKNYKVFESGTMKELHEYLDDLLLPFSDLGYEVTNHIAYGGGIGITCDYKHASSYGEFKDDLIRVLDYIYNTSNGKLGEEVNIKIATEVRGFKYSASYEYSFRDVIDNNIFIKDDDKIMAIGIGI
jgi:hypothetical protein